MIKMLLIVGTGSFIGGVLRFLVSRFFQTSTSELPYGTFIVNIIGCLIIGVLFGLTERGNLISHEWRMFLAVGFCGGLTTFSTFSLENLAFLREGNILYFALYAGLSVFFGLLATYAGVFATKM